MPPEVERPTRAGRDWPPASLWAGVVVVAALRALPWLTTITAAPRAGTVLPPIGYNPKDWLAYVAWIREAAVDGGVFLSDMFTTEPQDGRYLLLLQSVLGRVARLVGASGFTVLELARVPLLALFLLAFWRLSGVVLADRRARVAACWLVLFSGGVEVVVDALWDWVPAQIQPRVYQDLWHLQGWNTFAASYNPLWVAALALTLVTIVPLVRPGGPRGAGDAAILGIGLLVLLATHPYSAIVVVAVAMARPAVGWLLRLPGGMAGVVPLLGGLVPAVLAIAALSAWQNGDPVYRATSSNVLGSQALSIFWYPVTLGAVGVLAVRGWQRWIADDHPALLGMAAWTLAVVFLHTSPILNGYHFVFHLHVPLCLAAAGALVAAWDALRARPGGQVALVGLAVVLFQTPVSLTRKCVGEVETHRIRESSAQVLQLLATLPAGNVLSPADLGNYVPAYGPHRVFAGQWFLTPQYAQRAQQALAVARGSTTAPELLALVDAQRLRYLVVGTAAAPALSTVLGARVERTLGAGDLSIIVLAGGVLAGGS